MENKKTLERDKRRARRRARRRIRSGGTRPYKVPLDRYPMHFEPSGYVPNRVGLWRLAWLLGLFFSYTCVATALSMTTNPILTTKLLPSLLEFAQASFWTIIGLVGVLLLFAIIGLPLALVAMAIEYSAEQQFKPRKLPKQTDC